MQWLRALRAEASLVLDMRKRPPHAALFEALAAIAARRRRAAAASSTAAAATAAAAAAAFPGEFQRQFAEVLEEEEPRVRVAPSRIPASGQGVFAARALRCGEVAALYPGAIYAGLDLPALASPGYDSFRAAEPLLPPSGSEYLLIRGDSTKMDAGPVASGAGLAALVARCGVAAASGHLVQHPCAGTSPNIVDVSLDVPVFERHPGGLASDGAAAARAAAAAGGNAAPPFADDAFILPWRLLPRVPLWWAEAAPGADAILSGALPPITHSDVADAMMNREDADASRRACLLPAVILVATRDVAAGEELYLDYAFWGADQPSWYAPVPHETRWATYDAVVAQAAARGCLR